LESPFPKSICEVCHGDFTAFKSFFVKLNEGQAILADQLAQVDNVLVQMPNFLAEKKTLFKDKFPCMPKTVIIKSNNAVKKTKKEKQDQQQQQKEDLKDSERCLDLVRPSRRARKLPQR
jgi:hypothetical protein